MENEFQLVTEMVPRGDQPTAIKELIAGLQSEIDILRETDPVQQEMIRHREVLAAATEEERAAFSAVPRFTGQSIAGDSRLAVAHRSGDKVAV